MRAVDAAVSRSLRERKRRNSTRIGIAKSRKRRGCRDHAVLLWDHSDAAVFQNVGVLDVRHADGGHATFEQTLVGLGRLHQIPAKASEQIVAALAAALRVRRTDAAHNEKDSSRNRSHITGLLMPPALFATTIDL